jgi:hypothetical protein
VNVLEGAPVEVLAAEEDLAPSTMKNLACWMPPAIGPSAIERTSMPGTRPSESAGCGYVLRRMRASSSSRTRTPRLGCGAIASITPSIGSPGQVER